jgi:hypothetical protein
LIPFTDNDKELFLHLFGLSIKEVKTIVNKALNEVNDQGRWLLIKNNPIFIVFYFVIKYYTIKKDSKGVNTALAIFALANYPSIFTKYFKFEPNPGVMQYTIDNLPNKFTIKKTNHIFGTLMARMLNSWGFHKEKFKVSSDADIIAFIQRIRNDQNSFMKKIANVYMDNHAKNLSVYVTTDKFDDNAIVDVENDSNRVESVTNKIMSALLINGIDLRLAEASAKTSNVSVSETRNYLHSIVVEHRNDELKSMIESIIFLYLYEDNKPINDINSKDFLEFSLAIYKKTNSNNQNIKNIKGLLDKWSNEIGLEQSFTRKATLVDYKRAIYTFFVFTIQKYN